MTHRSIQLLLFTVFSFLTSLLHCQPGNLDNTNRYSYTILDANGQEIIFQDNKSFSIWIDSTEYNSSEIPHIELPSPVLFNELYQSIGNQILINDFSLTLPFREYPANQKQLEIKIVSENDTMFLFQPTQIGTQFRSTPAVDGSTINPHNQYIADLEIPFEAGHYYFPEWTNTILNSTKKFVENKEIVNLKHSNFIIPKSLYDTLLFTTRFNQEIRAKADQYILENFTRDHFVVDNWQEPTKLNRSIAPYENYYWNSPFYPSDAPQNYFGAISATMNISNCHSSKSFFAQFNETKNTVELWFPVENTRLFNSDLQFMLDTFNSILYQNVWMHESSLDIGPTDCTNNVLPKRVTYSSNNKGKTWLKNEKATLLFENYGLIHLKFIDDKHAIGATNREYSNKKGSKTSRATYYLFKDLKLIDSLQTPDNLNSNVSRYSFHYTFQRDTVFLKPWNDPKNDYNASLHHPILHKTSKSWAFEVKTNLHYNYYASSKSKPTINKKFNNVTAHKNRLILNNSVDTITLSKPVSNDLFNVDKGYLILENKSSIYLIDGGYYGSTLFSFDAGKTWYIYPLPLEKSQYEYLFLRIDKNGTISHLHRGREMHKVYTSFKPLNGG